MNFNFTTKVTKDHTKSSKLDKKVHKTKHDRYVLLNAIIFVPFAKNLYVSFGKIYLLVFRRTIYQRQNCNFLQFAGKNYTVSKKNRKFAPTT